MNTTALTLIAAVGGWLLSIVLACIAYLERRAQRLESTLLEALKGLAGSAQNRSIGIALVEGLWHKKYAHHVVLIPALASAAVFLLLDVDAANNRQEFHNWLRIMGLLLRHPYDKQFGAYYDEIHHALFVCYEEENSSRGIGMVSSTAEIWLKKLEAHWHIGHVANP